MHLLSLAGLHACQDIGTPWSIFGEQNCECLVSFQRAATSHTGFFHESKPRAAGRIAIAATFIKAQTADGLRWVFQDVHAGGAAALAGIRPGDTLLALGG